VSSAAAPSAHKLSTAHQSTSRPQIDQQPPLGGREANAPRPPPSPNKLSISQKIDNKATCTSRNAASELRRSPLRRPLHPHPSGDHELANSCPRAHAKPCPSFDQLHQRRRRGLVRSELRGRALSSQTINATSVHKRIAILPTAAAGRTRSERPASSALTQQTEHITKDR